MRGTLKPSWGTKNNKDRYSRKLDSRKKSFCKCQKWNQLSFKKWFRNSPKWPVLISKESNNKTTTFWCLCDSSRPNNLSKLRSITNRSRNSSLLSLKTKLKTSSATFNNLLNSSIWALNSRESMSIKLRKSKQSSLPSPNLLIKDSRNCRVWVTSPSQAWFQNWSMTSCSSRFPRRLRRLTSSSICFSKHPSSNCKNFTTRLCSSTPINKRVSKASSISSKKQPTTTTNKMPLFILSLKSTSIIRSTTKCSSGSLNSFSKKTQFSRWWTTRQTSTKKCQTSQ